ncbi:hypothetical protein PPM_2655 [Paenibacillus polymyxa M1]|uniref:hypothetical protein n=1 Tax=Paenibacillus polymyxa TaxID=1406 RepID=UPI00021BBD6E|nr:hypothetical protein [Paenibacillus polymyxa]CCC85592.1 hypothetical protein PPM_2655 [Paenibacillus polymyxa M1]
MNDETNHREFVFNRNPYLRASQGTWIQKDGEKKQLWQLEESHLKNCVKQVESDIKEFEKEWEPLATELVGIAKKKLSELRTEYMRRI